MRQELLAATERGLAEIAQRVTRGTLHGAGQIGLAVGPAVKRYRDQINSQSALDASTSCAAQSRRHGFYPDVRHKLARQRSGEAHRIPLHIA